KSMKSVKADIEKGETKVSETIKEIGQFEVTDISNEQEDKQKKNIMTQLGTEIFSKSKKTKKKPLKLKEEEIGQEGKELEEKTKEKIKIKALGIPVEQEEASEPDIITQLETEIVSKKKITKKKSLKPK